MQRDLSRRRIMHLKAAISNDLRDTFTDTLRHVIQILIHSKLLIFYIWKDILKELSSATRETIGVHQIFAITRLSEQRFKVELL